MKSTDIQFAVAGIQRHLDALTAEMDGVKRGKDPECIHRMRVASRRLRCALDVFADYFEDQACRNWVKSIRRMARVLGRARDADVHRDALNRLLRDCRNPKALPGIRRLHLRTVQERVRLQAKTLKALRKFEHHQTINRISQALQRLPARRIIFQSPDLKLTDLYHRSRVILQKHLERLLSYESEPATLDRPETIHRLRIAAKHLRYAAELFAPLYRDHFQQELTTLRDLQDSLGVLHDTDVRIADLPACFDYERRRTLDFFGRSGPFNRLQPGFQFILRHHRLHRRQLYRSFLERWNGIQQSDLWSRFMDQLIIHENNPPESAPETGNMHTSSEHEHRASG